MLRIFVANRGKSSEVRSVRNSARHELSSTNQGLRAKVDELEGVRGAGSIIESEGRADGRSKGIYSGFFRLEVEGGQHEAVCVLMLCPDTTTPYWDVDGEFQSTGRAQRAGH